MENRADIVEVSESHLLDGRKKLIIMETNRFISVELKDFDRAIPWESEGPAMNFKSHQALRKVQIYSPIY